MVKIHEGGLILGFSKFMQMPEQAAFINDARSTNVQNIKIIFLS
jgi:hypothetical protein